MLILLHTILSLLAFTALQDGSALIQLQSRRSSDLTGLEPQPENRTESRHFERSQPGSEEVPLGRHGDAWIFTAPELPPDVAVRNVKGFRNGKVMAEVALFGTNAMRTDHYLPGDYAQLKMLKRWPRQKICGGSSLHLAS